MITPAQRAEIRRLFYGEHWKVGTIAAQLGLHRETVRAAVERETAGVRPSLCRPSILEPVSAVHPRHPGAVPAAARHADPRDGPPARLCRLGLPGPPPRAAPAARVRPRRLPPGRDSGRGAGTSRLGLVRQGPHRTRHTHGLRIRHGPRLLARAGRAVHPRPDAGELPAGARRRLRGAGRRRPQPRVRQPAQRRARPPRRRRAVSSPPARPRRPLPLRTAPLHAGPGK